MLLSSLWRQALEAVEVLDVSTREARLEGHRSLVWDASALPAGGHYFPVYAHLLASLEGSGDIHPDRDILVETTTGTAGMALGWLARKLGYRIILFMPEDMPPHRIDAVRANLLDGSELHLSPAGAYVGGMVRAFQRFMIDHRQGYAGRSLFALDHSRRPEAVTALTKVLVHALGQVDLPNGLQFAVGALGNGTSSSALFQAARLIDPKALRVGVEPIEAPVGFIRKFGADAFTARFGVPANTSPHGLLGTGGWGVNFPLLDIDIIDEIFPLLPTTWQDRQQTAAADDLDLGNSSAACQAVIDELLRRGGGANTAFSIRYDRAKFY